jgi:hypothetical protein
MALYLPTLYGSFPIWHHGSTTPDSDGAISAIADASLGLYPVSQASGPAQPTRGSGKITFTANDYMRTVAAALAAYPDSRHAWTFWAIAELNAGTPGTNEALFSWGDSAIANNYIYGYHTVVDKLSTTHTTSAGGATNASAATQDATRAAYIFQGTGGASTETVSSYKNNSLTSMGANTAAIASHISNGFVIGALYRASPSRYFNGSIVACGALDRVMTSDERAQLQAWFNAGAPL